MNFEITEISDFSGKMAHIYFFMFLQTQKNEKHKCIQ